MYKENVKNIEIIKHTDCKGNITFPVISIFYLYMLFKKY